MNVEQLKKENQQLKQQIGVLEKEIEILRVVHKTRKDSMLKKASEGNLMSRAPFGYKIVGGKLTPAENFREIEEIFESFLNKKISLNQLAKEHNLSVNGLKKILKNFTYLGKVKFNNQIYDGGHPQILSSTLFNHVQNKLERLGIR
ncbi:MAG: recombinase family protein [archaeon]